MTSIINQAPYLRTQRSFPEDIKELVVQLDKGYIDTANVVNARTIGLFPINRPAINGEQWFIGSVQATISQTNSTIETTGKRQGLRQVYTFTAAGNIPHNITNFNDVTFTRIYGTFTDGTNWYPLPYVAIAGGVASQVQIIVDPVNIEINAGGGAPSISTGLVVLEWISQS